MSKLYEVTADVLKEYTFQVRADSEEDAEDYAESYLFVYNDGITKGIIEEWEGAVEDISVIEVMYMENE